MGGDDMDEVAGDGAVDGDPPWLLGMEHRQPDAAVSVEPPWWRRVGLGFIGGIGEGAAVPVG